MSTPSAPPLIGASDSHSLLTHAVKQVLPEGMDEVPFDVLVDVLVSTVAGVLAVSAWQLQEFVDHCEQQESLEGVTKLYVPFKPTWADVAVWLQRSRDSSPVGAEGASQEQS